MMDLFPRKLKNVDYAICFKLANGMILSYARFYIAYTSAFLIFCWGATQTNILLALAPILIVLWLFGLCAFAIHSERESSVRLSSLLNFIFKSKRYLWPLLIIVALIIAIFGPFGVHIASVLMPGADLLFGMNIPETDPIITKPGKTIGFLCMIATVSAIGFDMVTKAVVRYKYGLSSLETFSLWVSATELNRPKILLFSSLVTMTLFPCLFVWFVAPLGMIVVVNYHYYITKAMFDDSWELDSMPKDNEAALLSK